MSARLVTIPFSHYCEKARWALERAGVAFVEDGHLPMFAYLPLVRLRARRTVPALVTAEGTLVPDSTDILRWCDAHGRAAPLFPADLPEAATLEDEYDRVLGPATRRLAYFYLLASKPALRAAMGMNVPGWEATVGKAVRPLAAAMIRRGLKIDEAGAERSRARIDETFTAVGDRLADGRRYLCGDRFTAADLTFAALATPVLLPDAYARYLPARELVPAPLLALVEGYRRSPAGRFALRLYADERALTPP